MPELNIAPEALGYGHSASLAVSLREAPKLSQVTSTGQPMASCRWAFYNTYEEEANEARPTGVQTSTFHDDLLFTLMNVYGGLRRGLQPEELPAALTLLGLQLQTRTTVPVGIM
jgi:hypothetical protein